MRFSKRTVLRAGFAAVIAVLVLSAVEAYRIQSTVSRLHLEIYRHYVEQEATLAILRRNLWLAGNEVRDFFIHSTPAQAQILRSQLDALRAEDAQALDHLARTSPHAEGIPKLRQSLDEFWAVVDPVPQTMLHESADREFEFIQREIVPRRGELYSALLNLTAADQQRLQESEREFADARRRAARLLVAMLAFSVLLSLAVARFSLVHAETLERRAELHYEELQQLSARLLEIEEEGRRKLSRELHDEIGQTLALLQIEISHAVATIAAQPAAARERLQRARELAERTVQTVRNITVMLRPALLDDLGLVPALQFQLEDFSRRSGIAADFVEQGVADRLPDSVNTCVYRVVQEALHNCEKHSRAKAVRVAVRQFPDCLTVEIDDDGDGFTMDGQAKGTGLGLLGIRERAGIAGGSLTIDSAPGQGTRIALRIPVAVPAQVVAAASQVVAG